MSTRAKQMLPIKAQRGSRLRAVSGWATREEHAVWRKADTISDLKAALKSAERGYWGQCRERIESAAKNAKQWEAAADTWAKWPNGESSDRESGTRSGQDVTD